MRITKRQLLNLIREQQEIITEQQKFDRLLLEEEGDMGAMLKMAFSALKSAGEKIIPMLVQWLKSNPEILEGLIQKFVEDEKTKGLLMSAVEKISDVKEEQPTAEPASA